MRRALTWSDDLLTLSRRRALRPLVALASVAVAAGVITGTGTAQAAASSGDQDCLAEEYVPESGIALSNVGRDPSTQLRRPDTTVHAFGTGTDNQVWTRTVNGSGGWQSLGGVSLYGPAAVFSGSTSHVFVVGGDGAVWTSGNSGSGWSGWSSLGGYFVSSPAVASLGAGHVRVFGAGADGALWTNEFAAGRWSGWSSLGGRLATAPVATMYRMFGQVEVSVMGTDGLVWTMGLGQGARSGAWLNRGFAACSTLSAPSLSREAFPADRVYLDSTWAMRKPNANSYSTAEVLLGGGFVANPDVEYDLRTPFSVTIAGVGDDGALWVNDSGTSNSWRSLGGQFL